MRPGRSDQSGLRFISGIICKSKVLRFERMLFRATRGNMLFNQAPADEQIMDPLSTEMVLMFPYINFFLYLFSFLIFSDPEFWIPSHPFFFSCSMHIVLCFYFYFLIRLLIFFEKYFTHSYLSGWENSVCSFLLWGAGKNKDSENLWSIWCKLLSCARGYN